MPDPLETVIFKGLFLPTLLQKLVGDFFGFWEGNFVGRLAGILRDFFGPAK